MSRFVAVAAVLMLAACSSSVGEGRDSFPTQHAGRLHEIVYINPLPNNPLWDRIGACMKREAKRYGIDVQSEGPPGGRVDVQAMGAMLSRAVTARSQAVVTWSVGAPATFDPLFKEIRRRGGLVATLLSPRATRFQNFDVSESGPTEALVIDYIAGQPGQHRLGIIHQYDHDAYGDPQRYLTAAARRHPNVSIEEIRFNRGEFGRDIALAESMLTTKPGINALVTYSGYPGIATAIQEKKLVGKVHAYLSSDYPKVTVGFIDKGLIGANIVHDTCGTGRLTVRRLRDAWAGRQVKRHYDDGARVVSPREFKRLAADGRL